MKQTILSIAIFFLISIPLFAQEPPKIRFEKVSEEEIKMTFYEPDTTAEAVILFDEGSSEVKYDIDMGFMLTYNRFVRIKILKQTGTHWGDFSIPLYSSVKKQELIGSLKGTTFNFENGKVVKTEMKKESIFRERENKYWEMVRLSLPSVKIGSVIDLKYTISSPLLWNLRSWKFQYLIPVKWSQYNISYPEYFTYNHSTIGYHPLNPRNLTTKTENINYTTTEATSRTDRVGSGVDKTNHTITYQANVYKYSANNVPAMKEEPYLSSLENYTTMVKFELANIDLTKIGGKYENYTNSWNNVADELLADEDFGGQIKSANYAKEEITKLIAGKSDEKQKMIALYNFVQHSIKWNGMEASYPSNPLRKVFNEKNGNSADINLLLVAMLNEAGIEAVPVILSTRNNGILSVAHASLSDCNYLIAKIVNYGNSILLDATEPNLPAGLLPFRCLNGKGRMVKKDHAEEVSLTNVKSGSNTTVFVELKEGKFSGNVMTIETGLNAFNFRKSVKSAGGPKEYFDNIKNNSSDIQFVNYSFTKIDSLYQSAEKRYSIVLQNELEPNAEIIYIDPVLFGRINKNPFTSPTREYPVDYGVPFTESYQLNLTIPDGYSIEELPQSKSFALEGKGGSFIYKVVQAGNIISLSMRFNIDKTLFLPTEYKILKDFYDIVVAKQSEQIVLKKISK